MSENNSLLASVVIPAKDRLDLLERAIDSILIQDLSELVEIIIVDDCSSSELIPKNIRVQDRVIRNTDSLGAAVSRNKGIHLSSTNNIYLLDSDDCFIRVDFGKPREVGILYYCNVKSQGVSKPSYPFNVKISDFVYFITYKHPYIFQTSSLSFNKKSHILRFDEILPKHQDWDFVLNALINDVELKYDMDSIIFFDRGDVKSLSRSKNTDKSDKWFIKLSKNKLLSEDKIEFLNFYIRYSDSNQYNIFSFFVVLCKYLFSRKLRFRDALVRIYKRFI